MDQCRGFGSLSSTWWRRKVLLKFLPILMCVNQVLSQLVMSHTYTILPWMCAHIVQSTELINFIRIRLNFSVTFKKTIVNLPNSQLHSFLCGVSPCSCTKCQKRSTVAWKIWRRDRYADQEVHRGTECCVTKKLIGNLLHIIAPIARR